MQEWPRVTQETRVYEDMFSFSAGIPHKNTRNTPEFLQNFPLKTLFFFIFLSWAEVGSGAIGYHTKVQHTWELLVGSLQLQVSFAKEPYKRYYILSCSLVSPFHKWSSFISLIWNINRRIYVGIVFCWDTTHTKKHSFFYYERTFVMCNVRVGCMHVVRVHVLVCLFCRKQKTNIHQKNKTSWNILTMRVCDV